jgi:hypothetical protein
VVSCFGPQVFTGSGEAQSVDYVFVASLVNREAADRVNPLTMTISLRTTFHSLLSIGYLQLEMLANQQDCALTYFYISKAFRQKDYEYRSFKKAVEFAFTELGSRHCFVWIEASNFLLLSMVKTFRFRLVRTHKPEGSPTSRYLFVISSPSAGPTQQLLGAARKPAGPTSELSSGGDYDDNLQHPNLSPSPSDSPSQTRSHKLEPLRPRWRRTLVPNLVIHNYLKFKEQLQTINRVHGLKSAITKSSVMWYTPTVLPSPSQSPSQSRKPGQRRADSRVDVYHDELADGAKKTKRYLSSSQFVTPNRDRPFPRRRCLGDDVPDASPRTERRVTHLKQYSATGSRSPDLRHRQYNPKYSVRYPSNPRDRRPLQPSLCLPPIDAYNA